MIEDQTHEKAPSLKTVLDFSEAEPVELIPGTTLLCWTCGRWALFCGCGQAHPLTNDDFQALSQTQKEMLKQVEAVRRKEMWQLTKCQVVFAG